MTLKSSLRTWRSRFPTHVRNELSSAVRPLLEQMEELKQSGSLPRDLGADHMKVRVVGCGWVEWGMGGACGGAPPQRVLLCGPASP